MDEETGARDLARRAVEEKLAACAQLDSAIQSHYFWDGTLQESSEWRILFKTAEGGKAALVDWILAQHPYKVPEILAWSAESANPAYTDWAGNV